MEARLLAECLRILKQQDEPIVAADLATKLLLTGSRETKRRRVRDVIKDLRDQGNMIVATLDYGYALTNDPKIWSEYLDGRKIDAKRIFATTTKQKKYLCNANGQGLLFADNKPYSTRGL